MSIGSWGEGMTDLLSPTGARTRARAIQISIGLLLALSLALPVAMAQGDGTFAPPHADSGLDTDADSLFDFLQIEVEVNATTPGDFLIVVTLMDETNTSFITDADVFVLLDGPSTVPVNLSGPDIRESGFDGPYTANLLLLDDAFNLDDSDTHMTSNYSHEDFDGPAAAFAPPHADMGVDTEPDGLFDFLHVEVNVTVVDAGTYFLDADLVDEFFTLIASESVMFSASPGLTAVGVDFPGPSIYANGVNGSFLVFLSLFDSTFAFLDDDLHPTEAYDFTEFEAPPARFDPPHTDSGFDSDGDGLFNFISIDVSVLVEEAGEFSMSGLLWDLAMTTPLGFAQTTANLETGAQTMQLRFSTLPAVVSGIDGPYLASLSFFHIPSGSSLGFDSHETDAYPVTAFDPVPAVLEPPHTDTGVDRDTPPDGEYNLLEVNVTVNVTDPGSYLVGANLLDSTATSVIASDDWLGPLSPGTHQVPLSFPGVTIRDSGFDGPYFVNLTLVARIEPFQFVPIGGGGHTTQAFNATDFQSSTPAALTGTVRDAATNAGIPSAFVSAFNYLDRFSESVSTDSTGNYSLALYTGDWVLTYDDGGLLSTHQSTLLRIPLTASAVQDVELAPTENVINSADLTFTSYDAADVQMRSVNEADAPTFRVLFDWFFGDQNEILELAEFENFIEAFGALPTLPVSSQDMFLVDETDFDLVPGSDTFSLTNITGPIDSVVPAEFELTGSYVSNTTIPPAATHMIDLQVEYDFDILTNVYAIHVPSPDMVLGFTASPAVVVTGVGTDTAIVDPGPDPNPFDPVTSEWMSIEAGPDTTGPTVSGTTDSPDPVELGTAVTITTQVSDSGGVDSVQVEIRNPTGGLVGNFTMSNPSGTTYSHQFTPSVTGSFTYKITATDTAGNHAVVSGTLLVRDTTLPVADAGSDTTVANGTTVTFDASGSSDLGGIVTYSWAFNDDGAVTLTGSSPTHRFDNPGTFIVTLTVTDASGNSDTDTVVITVTATTGSIAGTVVGPAGQAISGATVRLFSGSTEVANTTADANGEFSFEDVAPGTYTLRIEAAGFETKSTSVTITAGEIEETPVELRALPAPGLLGLPFEIWALIIAVVAIVGIAAVLLRRRPKRPAQAPPPTESSESMSR
jgi:PKD repeat protein